MLNGLSTSHIGCKYDSFTTDTPKDVEFNKWLGGVPVSSKLRRKPGKYDIKFFRSWTMPDPKDTRCMYQKRNTSSATIIQYNLSSDTVGGNNGNIFNNNNYADNIRLKETGKQFFASARSCPDKVKFLTEFEGGNFNNSHAWHETINSDSANLNINVSVFQPEKLRVSFQRGQGRQRPLGTSRSCGTDMLSISDEYEDHITKKSLHSASRFHVRNEGFEITPTSLRISRPATVAHPRFMSTIDNYADPFSGKPFLNGNHSLPVVSQAQGKEKATNSLKIILPRSDLDSNSPRRQYITVRKSKSANNGNKTRSNNYSPELDTLLSVGGCSMGQKVDQSCTTVTKRNLGTKSDRFKQNTVLKQHNTKYDSKRRNIPSLEVTYDLGDNDKQSTVSQKGESVCLEETGSNAGINDRHLEEEQKGEMAERLRASLTSPRKDDNKEPEIALLESRLALAGLCLSPQFNITVPSSTNVKNSNISENKQDKGSVCLKGIYNMKNINPNVGYMADPEAAAKQERHRKIFGDGKTKRIVRFSIANQVHEYEA